MKRSDSLLQTIIATWRALASRAEGEALKSHRGARGRDPGGDVDTDLDVALDVDVDDLFVCTEGGLLLFTLLRVLLRNPEAAGREALSQEVATALRELATRAGLDAAVVVADGEASSLLDVELLFLAAFNEHLMMRHQERLRFVDGTSIELAKLGLAANLTANLTADLPADVDLDDAQAEAPAS